MGYCTKIYHPPRNVKLVKIYDLYLKRFSLWSIFNEIKGSSFPACHSLFIATTDWLFLCNVWTPSKVPRPLNLPHIRSGKRHRHSINKAMMFMSRSLLWTRRWTNRYQCPCQDSNLICPVAMRPLYWLYNYCTELKLFHPRYVIIRNANNSFDMCAHSAGNIATRKISPFV
jgi:hypothetical protein